MSYLVLARKFRPQSFNQVIQQEHVTRTLSNAIKSDRVAHAILFSGPRGTGKTTIARILAKAMNCKEGPTSTPCNVCRSCKEITDGGAVDVLEIDGASNNGVDQIRDLRENIKYKPAHSPYKIYIIDEVHMLSIAAFNALLKSLEEPPPHVMFLFATTEPNKIPITILSRCQRHDLRRIDLKAIADHLAFLCDQEGVTIDRESLWLIAMEAGGSMRDALSLLDQVMAGSEGEITSEMISELFGVVDRRVLHDFSRAVWRGSLPDILDILDDVYDHGYNLIEFYFHLNEHFRNLLIVKMGKNVQKLVNLPAHEIELMTEQVRDVGIGSIRHVHQRLFQEESFIKFSTRPKMALEVVFIKIFQTRPTLPIEVLIEKLDNLKDAFSSGSGEELLELRPVHIEPPAVRPPGEKAAVKSGEARPASPVEESVAPEDREESPPPSESPPVKTDAREEEAPPPAPTEEESVAPEDREEPPAPSEAPPVKANAREAQAAAPVDAPGRADDRQEQPEPPVGKPVEEAVADAKAAVEGEEGEETEEVASPVGETAAGPDDSPEAAWKKMLEAVEEKHPSLYAALRNCTLKSAAADTLELEATGNDFAARTIRRNKNMAILKRFCAECFGREMELVIHAPKRGMNGNQEKRRLKERLKKDALSHPLVSDAIEIFNGRVLDVKILQEVDR